MLAFIDFFIKIGLQMNVLERKKLNSGRLRVAEFNSFTVFCEM